MTAFNLPETTHALRLVRCVPSQNKFVFYEGVTFPEAPEGTRAICDMYLRRASICGKIGKDIDSLYTIDILDADGNVLEELPAERKAARYLIDRLQINVERDE